MRPCLLHPPAGRDARRGRPAFTLVEILAVLAVIAAILAIGIPAIAKVLQSGRIRNAEGTAAVLKSAIATYLSRSGSLGTLPITESASTTAPVLPLAEWSGDPSLDTAAASKAATLDNILLTEGVLDHPLSLRVGNQNFMLPGGSVPLTWSAATETFTNTVAPTADYTNATRVECAQSDGASDPGSTGSGPAACAFDLTQNGFLPPGTRVAYLVIKGTPVADAYRLALDVDGPSLMQNAPNSPALNDQALGAVVYQKDTGSGLVDVYYYLMSL